MCLIAVKQVGSELPKDEHLMEASLRNKDGIGVMYWKAGSNDVVIKKNFISATELIIWLKENITKEDACVIHFRLATHGLVDEGNRHPFPITKNTELLRQTELICQMAVMHNGVLNQYAEHKKYSDTQKFILDILAEEDIKNNLDNEKIRKLITYYLGGDRLAILRNDGSGYLFGSFVQEGDILYSNSGYKSYKIEKRDYTNWTYTRPNNNDKGYKGQCECCGEDKHVLWTEDLSDKIQSWLLCKSCRKQYRKGNKKVEDFAVNIPDEDETTEGNTCVIEEKQCENCLEWYPENAFVPYYGYSLCRKCVDELNAYEARQVKDKR